jgi:hypothetical protein
MGGGGGGQVKNVGGWIQFGPSHTGTPTTHMSYLCSTCRAINCPKGSTLDEMSENFKSSTQDESSENILSSTLNEMSKY